MEKPIGQSIRLLRFRAQLVQGEMARVVGCSVAVWSSYETGRAEVPVHVLDKVKDYFDWDGSPVERTPEEIADGEELRKELENIFTKAKE